MATVFDSPFIRQRLNRLRNRDFEFEEDQRFGRCDCTSYSYFVLSMVLFSVGTVITVLALGDADGYILSNLGHMWLVGPIFICSGMMVAVKSMLYLRRKSVIQMLLHRRALIRVSTFIMLYYQLNIAISRRYVQPLTQNLLNGNMQKKNKHNQVCKQNDQECMLKLIFAS